MEQKRRTISSTRKKNSSKTFWTAVGIILALALIFYVSYRLSYGLFSPGDDGKEATQSTQEDIANMSREELENKYTELQEKLAEKDKEIEMLTERLEKGEDKPITAPEKEQESDESREDESRPAQKEESAPEAPRPSQNTEHSAQPPQPAQSAPEASTPAPPPAAPFEPSSELITPDDLAAMEQAARQ